MKIIDERQKKQKTKKDKRTKRTETIVKGGELNDCVVRLS